MSLFCECLLAFRACSDYAHIGKLFSGRGTPAVFHVAAVRTASELPRSELRSLLRGTPGGTRRTEGGTREIVAGIWSFHRAVVLPCCRAVVPSLVRSACVRSTSQARPNVPQVGYVRRVCQVQRQSPKGDRVTGSGANESTRTHLPYTERTAVPCRCCASVPVRMAVSPDTQLLRLRASGPAWPKRSFKERTFRVGHLSAVVLYPKYLRPRRWKCLGFGLGVGTTA